MSTELKYFLFPLLIFGFACTKKVGPLNYGEYPHEIGEILVNHCATAGCHNKTSYEAASSLNLETWADLFKGASSGAPVVPYSSRFSSLCYFINSYPELGSQSIPRMPLNDNSLSYAQVKKIKDWIDAGAPDRKGNIYGAGNPKRKKLYAVNQGCDVVTVLDAESRLPIRYIDVGTRPDGDVPHQVRVSPDGNYWYVIFLQNNILQKFRCSDDSYVGSIPLTPLAAGQSSSVQDDAFDWNTFVISRDGKRAYCASLSSSGKVAAVDLEKRSLLHYQAGIINAHGIALNATEDFIYVTAQTGNFITRLDTGFMLGTLEIPLENGAGINYSRSLDPHDIILSEDGKNFLITCQESNEVRVYSIDGASVTAIVKTGTFPQEITYSTALKQYFVSCTNDKTNGANGSVYCINGADYSAKGLACGYQPHGVAVDEERKILYVLSRNIASSGPPPHHTPQCGGRNGFVNFIDLRTFTLMPEKYELSVDPYFIFARP